MKFPINLASQPFRRDRAIMVASVAVSVLLAASLVALILLARVDNAQLADVRREVYGLRSQIEVAARQQRDAEGILRQPQNADVLLTSVFLNTLLYRKGISWTRILGDLEKVMPFNVKVINIRPYVNGRGQITLDMLVGSDGPKPIIGMYQSLEKSSLFGGVLQQQYVPPSQAEPMHRYRFTVNYAQKL